MATHPGHPLAPISEALNAWQVWDQNWRARDARPDLGEVLGIGSANTVFSLDRVPDLVLRVRHNTASLSLNSPTQEIALWRSAAALGLAPDVLWAGPNEDIVITKRLTFEGIDEDAHSHLLKSVHESTVDAPRLSLEKAATRYTEAIGKTESPCCRYRHPASARTCSNSIMSPAAFVTMTSPPPISGDWQGDTSLSTGSMHRSGAAILISLSRHNIWKKIFAIHLQQEQPGPLLIRVSGGWRVAWYH